MVRWWWTSLTTAPCHSTLMRSHKHRVSSRTCSCVSGALVDNNMVVEVSGGRKKGEMTIFVRSRYSEDSMSTWGETLECGWWW